MLRYTYIACLVIYLRRVKHIILAAKYARLHSTLLYFLSDFKEYRNIEL
jgi:hypothetical protein